MNTFLAWLRRHRIPLGIAGLVVVSLLVGYLLRGCISPRPPVLAPAKTVSQPVKTPKVQMWTCAMHPQIRQPRPGKCPICRMDLVRVRTEGEGGSLRQFVTSAAAKALMDIQTHPVERRFVTAKIRMVGKVRYDETKVAYITAWVPGRLDRLYVDYTGVPVEKGDHMVYLYSPELLAAQEELLQALRAVDELKDSKLSIMKETALATVEAVREKLRLWGLKKEQVDEIEKRGLLGKPPSDHLTIYAPIGGIVVHKNAQEGMYVKTGSRIYTIADLRGVWVKLDAYESDLIWLHYGQRVTFAAEAYPGETFVGTITFIDPVLDERTRTVKVRVNVPNLDGKLKPNMFVRAVVEPRVAAGGKVMAPDLAGKWICPMHGEIIKDEAGRCDICEMPLVKAESRWPILVREEEEAKPLVIPASAPLLTGTRAVVYVAVPGTDRPTFEGREIVLGPRAGNYYIVRSGLKEGEWVVTHGNFKIDSALQIQAKPSMMSRDISGEKPKDVPAAFLARLRGVQAAYRDVVDAVKAANLDKIKAAFVALGRSVEAIDVTVSGRALLVWKELAMRLKNDAVEGGYVIRLKDARRVLDRLMEDIRTLQAQFGTQAVVQPLKAPAAFRRQLGALFQAYLAAHAALAADNQKSAAQATTKAQEALAAVDMALLKGRAHQVWMKELSSFRKALRDMTGAKDLAGLRAGFALLSEELSVVVRTFGLAPVGPVYQFRCPMAFNKRGATWLQKDKKTRNPYFGTQMLQCGGVIDTIVGEEARMKGQKHE